MVSAWNDAQDEDEAEDADLTWRLVTGVRVPLGAPLAWPLAVVFVRLPLLVGLGALVGLVSGPVAGGRWLLLSVVVSVDLLTLLFLWRLLTLEDRSITTVLPTVPPDWKTLRRDGGLGLSLGILGLLVVGTTGVLSPVPAPTPALTTTPAEAVSFAALAVVVVTSLSTAIAEECLYRGYALPRIEARTGSTALAVLVTAAGVGIQHSVVPVVLPVVGPVGMAAPVALGLVLGLAYVRLRRLLPLVVAHWTIALVSVAGAVFVG